MEKVTDSISGLETKMMNNHKTLMNKVETINRKMDKALHLAKKKWSRVKMKFVITKSKLRKITEAEPDSEK